MAREGGCGRGVSGGVGVGVGGGVSGGVSGYNRVIGLLKST